MILCRQPGCNGELDTSNPVTFRLGLTPNNQGYVCLKCRRLHWGDGTLVFKEGKMAFLDEGSSQARLED